MKYAKIQSGKIVDTQIGLAPVGDGWVEVQKLWAFPIEYPSHFYAPSSNKPTLTIVGNEVHETWGFILKDVDAIKDVIYEGQKKTRQAAQLGSFTVNGVEIILKDREDSLIIASLSPNSRKFKIGKGQWVTLTGVEVQALKDAHEAHVQAAYDAEEAANTLVSAMTTHEELIAY